MTATPNVEEFAFIAPMQSDFDAFVDLYCGGGGSGEGILRAYDKMGRVVRGRFYNHSWKALMTHNLNHPEHVHRKEDLFLLDPKVEIPAEIWIPFLWASIQCTHFSIARGAAPVNEQQRSHADTVLQWLRHLRPNVLMIENVKEFLDWGPLMQKRDAEGNLVWAWNNRALKTCAPPRNLNRGLKENRKAWEGRLLKKGFMPEAHRRRPVEREATWERRMVLLGYDRYMIPDPALKKTLFNEWVGKVRAEGNIVEWKLLKSANYGDPTIRTRLFIQVIRIGSGMRVCWPNPTHGKPVSNPESGLMEVPGGLPRWRTARDIIDWSLKGESVFTRKKKLVPATMRRLAIGLVKFGLKEFMVPGNKGFDQGRVKSPDTPMGALTTTNRGEGIAQPAAFQLPKDQGFQGDRVKSIDEPVATVQTTAVDGVIIPELKPFISPNFGERDGQAPRTHDIDEPLPTATSHGAGGLVAPELKPFTTPSNKGWSPEGAVRDIDKPVETLTRKSRANAVAEPQLAPFVIPKQGVVKEGSPPRSVDEPAPTVITDGRVHIAQPCVVQLSGQSTAMDIDAPVGAVHGDQKQYILEPQVIHMRGNMAPSSTVSSVDDPVRALTTAGTHEVLAEALLQAIDESFCVNTDQVGSNSSRDTTYSPDDPVKTVVSKANQAVARISITRLEEFVVDACPPGVDASRVLDLLHPLVEELRKAGRVDIRPWVYVYYGSGAVGADIDTPVPTARTHDSLGVCYPVLEIDGEFLLLDIFYRMFTVLELQRAQGFPDEYKFFGTKSDAVEAIGNSVSCGVAEAITLAVLGQDEDISKYQDIETKEQKVA